MVVLPAVIGMNTRLVPVRHMILVLMPGVRMAVAVMGVPVFRHAYVIL